MKFRFLVFPLAVLSCKNFNIASKNPQNDKSIETNISIENKKFFVGDVNNDNINDTAYVNFKRNIKTDEVECEEKNCYIHIKFKNIPEISFDQSLGVFISQVDDINNDNANEIIIFSRRNEGWWNDISVWSFKNKIWNVLAETKGFISENNDLKNRVINENGIYYLIGQNQWEEDENGDFKKVKVKIKPNG